MDERSVHLGRCVVRWETWNVHLKQCFVDLETQIVGLEQRSVLLGSLNVPRDRRKADGNRCCWLQGAINRREVRPDFRGIALVRHSGAERAPAAQKVPTTPPGMTR